MSDMTINADLRAVGWRELDPAVQPHWDGIYEQIRDHIEHRLRQNMLVPSEIVVAVADNQEAASLGLAETDITITGVPGPHPLCNYREYQLLPQLVKRGDQRFVVVEILVG